MEIGLGITFIKKARVVNDMPSNMTTIQQRSSKTASEKSSYYTEEILLTGGSGSIYGRLTSSKADREMISSILLSIL